MNDKIYGECPHCGYELTVGGSNYAPTGGEDESFIMHRLLEYHFDAEPECKKNVETEQLF